MKLNSVQTFGRLVEECSKVGISRTLAFKLVRLGVLETFSIGKRRFVCLESLRTLPQRMPSGKPAYGGTSPSDCNAPKFTAQRFRTDVQMVRDGRRPRRGGA